MNWNQVEGNWKIFKGKVKEQWGDLTQDDIDGIDGRREQLVGQVQKRYGITQEEAERQVQEWSQKHLN